MQKILLDAEKNNYKIIFNFIFLNTLHSLTLYKNAIRNVIGIFTTEY